MARPREFDRDAAIERAMSVFWRKGYAATSTGDLLRAMNIGRQSMYDTFGDKHLLYLEALEKYQRESVAENIRRLRSTASPLAGIEAFVIGILLPINPCAKRAAWVLALSANSETPTPTW